MKVVFCLFSFAFWKKCPWSDPAETLQSDNFLKSFKITLSTLYQTFFCGIMLSMTMGLKITKQKLMREEAKKIVIIAGMQYIGDSLYSVGSYMPNF
jgi:hypothetical protein